MTTEQAENLLWVAEVRHCGARKANLYLAHGYKLIAVGRRVFEEQRRSPPQGQPESVTFIAHSYEFIMARDADTEPYDPSEDEAQPVA